MEWFNCLFCLKALKDSELVCAASCDHCIHEWCVETMKSIDEHRCKICDRNIVVHSVFSEFNLERAVQIQGVPMMVQKLDEIANLIKTRDRHTNELQKNIAKISDKLERLSIEHRAVKFEKKDIEKRLRKLEGDKKIKSEDE